MKAIIIKNLICLSPMLLLGCDQVERIDDIPIGKAVAAMELCGKVFISNQPIQKSLDDFIAPRIWPLHTVLTHDVDFTNKTVEIDTNLLNANAPAKAMYREGIGCAMVLEDSSEEQLNAQSVELIPPPQLSSDPWPLGSGGLTNDAPSGIDYEKIEAAFDEAFSTADDVQYEAMRNTTATLVVYQGKLIAERYAEGFSPSTPQQGWSMSKSVTGLLLGIAQEQGYLNYATPVLFEEWLSTDKEEITYEHLFHMSSGLSFEEGYAGTSDVTNMLFFSADQAAYAASLPLLHEPNTEFNYSTGSTVMLASAISSNITPLDTLTTTNNVYEFYQSELFHKIDVTSASVQHDITGAFTGGAHMYLTPRDWARVGLLVLQEGSWDGQQVVSDNWVEYMLSPSPTNNEYGGQLWLNSNNKLPNDHVYFSGNQGQYVGIIPSLDLIVVRMGVTQGVSSGINDLMESIVDALP